jgi:hypothetical protein
MGGKFNTDQLEQVVKSSVTIEASGVWAAQVLKEGGLGKVVKLVGVLMHALPAAQALVGLNLEEVKNEVLELDSEDTAKVLAAFKAQLTVEGQSTAIADDVNQVVALVQRSIATVQDWVTEVKKLLAKLGITL